MLPIIWMSPGNSYFKDKEVAFLLRETINKYGKAVVLVADVPAISTYLALWYNPSKARKKAILKGNNLKNRTIKVIETMWLDRSKLTIVDRNVDIQQNALYRTYYQTVEELYIHNSLFKSAVDTTCADVLDNAWQAVDEQSIQQATHYLLSEIAFLEFAPDYFGVDKIGYVYHKNRFVFEDYVAWLFDGKIRSSLEFILLEAPYEKIQTNELAVSRRETIQQRKSIKCSYVPYYWFFHKHDDGSFSWIFYEKLCQFASRHDLLVEFVEQSGYGTLTDRLNSWAIDLFCSPTRPNESRKMEMFFSHSLWQSDIFLYMSATSRYKDQEMSLLMENQKLRIAVKENDIHHNLAMTYFPHATLVRVPQLSHISEVMQLVHSGRADMTFWDPELVALYCHANNIDPTVFIQKQIHTWPIATYGNCFALPWWEFALKDALDECLVPCVGNLH